MDFARLGIEVDTKGVKDGVTSLKGLTAAGLLADRQTTKLGKTFLTTAAAAQKLGLVLTAGITLPLAAIAKASVSAGIEFDRAMSRVATLIPGNTQRLNELRAGVQSLSRELGDTTSVLADGLFEVVSAFSDTSESLEILELNSLAAAAGFSTVTEAVKLTSAVTKAYGDTSLEAQEKVLDLAFATNRLGQTTFPELASAITQVSSLAVTLGIEAEEMFAVFATGTGVLGDASRVATQFRGAMQALLTPTDEMRALFKVLGVESGEALLELLSLPDALSVIGEASEAANIPLQKLTPSIEAMQLVLGLSGPLADQFRQKLREIENSTKDAKAAIDAFRTENALDIAFKRLTQSGTTFFQSIKEFLEPTLLSILETFNNLASRAVGIADSLAELSDAAKQNGVFWIALVTALGPAIAAFGLLLSVVGVFTVKFLALSAAISAGGAIVTLLITRWDDVKEALSQIWANITTRFETFVDSMFGEGTLAKVKAGAKKFIEVIGDTGLGIGFAAADVGGKVADNLTKAVKPVTDTVKAVASDIGGPLLQLFQQVLDQIGGLAEQAQLVGVEQALADLAAQTDQAAEKIRKLSDEEKKRLKVEKDLTPVTLQLARDQELLNNRFAVFGDRVDFVTESIANIRQAIEKLIAAKNFEGVGRLLSALEQLERQQKAKEEILELGDTLNSTMSTMVDSVLRGTQSMKDAFKDLGRNIILTFTSKAVQSSIDSLFDQIARGAANGQYGPQALNAPSSSGNARQDLGRGLGFTSSTTAQQGGRTAGAASFAAGGRAAGGAAAGFGIGSALSGSFGKFGREGDNVQDFGEKGFVAGATVGAGIGTLLAPGVGTVIGAGLGGIVGGSIGSTIGGLSQKETRKATLIGLIGGPIGGAIGAKFFGKDIDKPEFTAKTFEDFLVKTRGKDAGGKGEGALLRLIEGIDQAVLLRLTRVQGIILEEDLEGTAIRADSRKVSDAINEVAFKRLQQVLRSVGEEAGIDDLSKRVLTGNKFSEEKLANTLQAIEFINTFDSSIEALNSGLADTQGTVDRLARDSMQELHTEFKAFREETERLGLDVGAANDAIKTAVEIMAGLRDAKEPLSDTEIAIQRVHAEFEALGPLLEEVGISAEAAGQGLIRALSDIRQGFEDEIQRQINAFRSPITNTLEDLFATQAQRLSDAQAVNADLGPVVELIGEEFKAVVAGLDPTQLQTAIQLITKNVRDLGDALGGNALVGLSSVFAPSPAILATNQRIAEATEELERLQGQVDGTSRALGRVQATANDVAKVFESLGKFRQRLLQGQFSTLSPGARFAQAQGQFESTASRALSGDIAALQELETVSDAFLQANQDYFASSNPKAFTRVLEVLGQAQSISELEFVTAQRQALTLENQLASLERQVEIQEDELQKEIDSLAELEALNQGQSEQTLALETAIQAVGNQIAAATQAQTEAANAATAAALNAANATDVQTQAVTDLLTEINANVNEGNRNAQQLVGAS